MLFRTISYFLAVHQAELEYLSSAVRSHFSPHSIEQPWGPKQGWPGLPWVSFGLLSPRSMWTTSYQDFTYCVSRLTVLYQTTVCLPQGISFSDGLWEHWLFRASWGFHWRHTSQWTRVLVWLLVRAHESGAKAQVALILLHPQHLASPIRYSVGEGWASGGGRRDGTGSV